jgi:hypothetical protein
MDNTLELKIKSTLKEVLPLFDELKSKITGTDKAIVSMKAKLNKKGEFNGVTVGMKETVKQTDKATSSVNTLKKALTFGGIMYGVKKAFGLVSGFVKESVDYSENLNLFNVVMGKNTDEAMKFQNVMNEVFGTNQSTTLKYQGFFQSMAQNMGIANNYALMLSTNLTKLGFDLASLYNLSDESAMQKLRAGLAGQTKPLRDIGLDITQQSLDPIIKRLNLTNDDGTDKTIRQLSQAEKMVVRYIAILEQSTSAHGDFARTIESPANQLKILGMQAKETGRAIGNFFIGALASVLPYVNGFLMAIKEVFKALASFMGIDVSSYNTGIASMEDAFVDVDDTIGDTTNKASKLKNMLLGFDEINNIGTQDASVGSIGLGSVDPKILDAMSGYDNLMDNIKMKATGIRDNLLSWLGITREVNEETGEVSYKFSLTPKSLVGIGATALIAGGAISKVVGGVGGILTKLGLLTPKVATVGTTVAGATGKVGLFKLFLIGAENALGALGGAIVGTVGVGGTIGLGALAAALGVVAYKGLQPAIKETNLFGKGISKATKEKLEPFIDDINSLNTTVKKIDLADIVSDSAVNEIKTNTNKIATALKNDYLKDVEEVEKKLRDKTLYPSLSDEERANILSQVQQTNKDRITEIEKCENRINEIYTTASNENRSLKDAERTEINTIIDDMKNKGIKTLTESEEEQRLIYTRMKQNNTALTVQQYSDILKEAKKNKEAMIKEAQDKKDEEYKLANQLYYDLGVIDEAKYNEMLKNADTNYNEAVTKADTAYKNIAESARINMGDASKYVDTETGKIKSNFSVWWDGWKADWNNVWGAIKTGWGIMFDDINRKFRNFKDALNSQMSSGIGSGGGFSITGKYTTGSNGGGGAFADGGFPTTGQMFVAREAGPELVGTMGGRTAVANNDQIVQGIKQGVYEAVSMAMRNGGNTVQLDVRADEGIIVKKAVDGINGITHSTGECPIDMGW